jgi:hypothetical protein
VAALAPSAPATVTTTQDGTNVIIGWSAPTTNGLAVTQYDILIKKKDGTYASTSTCTGSSNTIVTNRYCSVPMSTLRTDYSLVLNDVVYAKVMAYNSMGWSAYTESTSLSSTTVKTEPSAPSTTVTRGASTSTS